MKKYVYQFKSKDKEINNFLHDNHDEKFRYMMLGRLKFDCNYFLGCGNRFEKSLWAGNVDDHIRYMKFLYLMLPINEKPEWLTMDKILDYEKRMKNN